MKGRLGVYERSSSDNVYHVDGVFHHDARMDQHGGNTQQERMIRDKRRSLDSALKFSYQGADVIKFDAEDKKKVRALINPNKLKQDYDDKIISVGYEYDFKTGTIFEWCGTGTYWIVYLQDLTELAYFRGDIRRCSYEICWEDEKGEINKTYAAVRGPVETKINFIQKHSISVDQPNHSLSILMPLNDHVLNYFKRYSKFYLQGNTTCWRVEAVDSISTPGIVEVIAVEYYSNQFEDDIDEGIAGALIQKIEEPDQNGAEDFYIEGNSFIKIKTPSEYKFIGDYSAEWTVSKKVPIEFKFDEEDPRIVIITWTQGYSGSFDLYYGDYKKTIVVESLF